MPPLPFIEYCSLHYLDIWFSRGRRIHLGLRSNDDKVILRSLTDAMTSFQVARNFPKKYDVDLGQRRYAPLLKIVKRMSNKPRPKRLMPGSRDSKWKRTVDGRVVLR